MKRILLLMVFSFVLTGFSKSQNTERPRLMVLTDIGGDPDDIQSLRRLLLYSCEFRIEGFIATATEGPVGKRISGIYGVNEGLILDAISDYGKIRSNLLLHDTRYPEAETLKAVVFSGQPNRGVKDLVPGKSTPGSQHIIDAVDKSDEILNIVIWGGAHDLAQALLDIKSIRQTDDISRFISKIRIYAINDQDKKYAPEGTGEWIRANFPKLRYIEAGPPWMNIFSACYRGMYQNDALGGEYEKIPLVKPGVEKLNQMDWLKANIFANGALCAGYPAWVMQNPQTGRNRQGVKEGDTPSWFYFLPNGLSDPDYPEWGCWGGRFEQDVSEHYTDAQDNHWTGSMQSAVRRKWTVARWREAYQNDFAARARWCVLPYAQANHNPVPVIKKDSTKKIIYYQAHPGQKLSIDAANSFDPDGNKIQYKWWIYHEVTSSSALLKNSVKKKVQVIIPQYATPGEIHIILELKDNGEPALSSYRRVIVKVL